MEDFETIVVKSAKMISKLEETWINRPQLYHHDVSCKSIKQDDLATVIFSNTIRKKRVSIDPGYKPVRYVILIF